MPSSSSFDFYRRLLGHERTNVLFDEADLRSQYGLNTDKLDIQFADFNPENAQEVPVKMHVAKWRSRIVPVKKHEFVYIV